VGNLIWSNKYKASCLRQTYRNPQLLQKNIKKKPHATIFILFGEHEENFTIRALSLMDQECGYSSKELLNDFFVIIHRVL
jgi:hypothetical protein